ncbi:MAG: acetylxylan esterase [Candidatus Omnitrophica bacterium]|nr:acetylxylan esterase [Candidatus Omnitrophota bacterium]
MIKNVWILFSACLLLSAVEGTARQQKEFDSDVIYDEQKLPRYTLPPLLETAEGRVITSSQEWFNIRRPQILSLFATMVYGTIPVPPSPLRVSAMTENDDPQFMGGKVTRRLIWIRFRNDQGSTDMRILVFTPNNATEPVPAIMHLSFDDNQSEKLELNESKRNHLNNGVPIGDIVDRGYAYISVYHADLVGHNEVEFNSGIHPLFYKEGQSFPEAHEWGVLSACGWTAMRALDYLETDNRVDHQRVFLMGHSKLGKATLWAAAQDQRFAGAISAQSGCGGAALWRRRSGETLEKISRFPHWLCTNSRKFINREEDLPVDQHMLLALIAPRPVYVASAIEDTWADPRGEYLSAYHASEVYRLLGKKGLAEEESPSLNEPIIESDVGYHIRPGGHSVDPYDWVQFLDFADYHLKNE